MRFEGKVCVVTGAGGGIGGAIAETLAREGGIVVAADIKQEAAERVLRPIIECGGKGISVKCDVRNEADWATVMDAALSSFKRVDVLVNSAGTFGTGAFPIIDMPLDEWRLVMGINIEGTFLGTREAVRVMHSNKIDGAIVNVGSMAGYFGARSGVAYGTSKAAVAGFTQQSAFNCIRLGTRIRINAVHPGYVLTQPVLEKAIKNLGTKEAALKSLASRNPSNRSITAADVAGLVAYLASDEAKMINGSNYVMDDGLSTYMPGVAFH